MAKLVEVVIVGSDMAKPEQTSQHFSRLIILRNPHSTRAADSLGLVPVLRGFFETSQITELNIDHHKSWLKTLLRSKQLGPDSLLAVFGGDGTLNMVVSTLLGDNTVTAADQKTVILPLWGGNANDLARMLNGVPSRAHVRQVMRSGHIVTVRPVTFEITSPHGKAWNRLALCYASFGASASVAKAINDTTFRKITRKTLPVLRFGRELLLVVTTLGQAPRFKVRDYKDGRSSTHRIYERVFLNGSRLAKVERVALKLIDEHFYQTDVARMRLGALFSRALELSDRRFAGKVAETHMHFDVLSSILAQFDGEHVAIKSGTSVEVSLGKEPFYALSTRMKDADKTVRRLSRAPGAHSTEAAGAIGEAKS